MNKILSLPLLLVLGCGIHQEAEHLQPRDLDIRPAIELVAGLGQVADMLDSCAPLAVSGPIVAVHYEEKSPPDADTIEWVLTVHAPFTSSPAKTAECIRELLIGAGGVELPPVEETGGSSTGG